MRRGLCAAVAILAAVACGDEHSQPATVSGSAAAGGAVHGAGAQSGHGGAAMQAGGVSGGMAATAGAAGEAGASVKGGSAGLGSGGGGAAGSPANPGGAAGTTGGAAAGSSGAPMLAAEVVVSAPVADVKQGVFGMCARGAEIFFHNGIDGVRRAPAAGGAATPVATSEVGAPAGLTCDDSGVYWATRPPGRAVRRFDVTSGTSSTLWQATVPEDPNGILLIQGQEELYVSTRGTARIGRLSRSGGTPTFLLASSPDLLPPLARDGVLFWTSFLPFGQGSPPTAGAVHRWAPGDPAGAALILASDRVGPVRLASTGTHLLWLEPLRDGDKLFRMPQGGGEPAALPGTAEVTLFAADEAGMVRVTPQGVVIADIDGSTKGLVINPSPSGVSLLLTPTHVYLGALDRPAIWRAPR